MMENSKIDCKQLGELLATMISLNNLEIKEINDENY